MLSDGERVDVTHVAIEGLVHDIIIGVLSCVGFATAVLGGFIAAASRATIAIGGIVAGGGIATVVVIANRVFAVVVRATIVAKVRASCYLT